MAQQHANLRYDPKRTEFKTVHGPLNQEAPADVEPVFTNLNPSEDDTYKLGDATHRWHEGHWGTGVVTVDGATTINGPMTVTGSSTLGDDASDVTSAGGNVRINGELTVDGSLTTTDTGFAHDGDILPALDDTYDLGDPTHRWTVGHANYTFSDTVEVNGNMTTTGSTSWGVSTSTHTLAGFTPITGNLNIERSATIGSVDVGGLAESEVTGATSGETSVTLPGTLTHTGDSNNAGNSTIGNGAGDSHTFEGYTNINGRLNITGTVTGVDEAVTGGTYTPVLYNVWPIELNTYGRTCTGRYIVVGNIVQVWFNIRISAVASRPDSYPINLEISLPFARFVPPGNLPPPSAYFAGWLQHKSVAGEEEGDTWKTDIVDQQCSPHVYPVILGNSALNLAALTTADRIRFTAYRFIHRYFSTIPSVYKDVNFTGYLFYEKA